MQLLVYCRFNLIFGTNKWLFYLIKNYTIKSALFAPFSWYKNIIFENFGDNHVLRKACDVFLEENNQNGEKKAAIVQRPEKRLSSLISQLQ